jgi:hypothetical protein
MPLPLFGKLTKNLETFKTVKRLILETLETEKRIRELKILETQDLDHTFIRRVLESLDDKIVVRVYLKSGELVEMYRRTDAGQVPEKGEATW